MLGFHVYYEIILNIYYDSFLFGLSVLLYFVDTSIYFR